MHFKNGHVTIENLTRHQASSLERMIRVNFGISVLKIFESIFFEVSKRRLRNIAKTDSLYKLYC